MNNFSNSETSSVIERASRKVIRVLTSPPNEPDFSILGNGNALHPHVSYQVGKLALTRSLIDIPLNQDYWLEIASRAIGRDIPHDSSCQALSRISRQSAKLHLANYPLLATSYKQNQDQVSIDEVRNFYKQSLGVGLELIAMKYSLNADQELETEFINHQLAVIATMGLLNYSAINELRAVNFLTVLAPAYLTSNQLPRDQARKLCSYKPIDLWSFSKTSQATQLNYTISLKGRSIDDFSLDDKLDFNRRDTNSLDISAYLALGTSPNELSCQIINDLAVLQGLIKIPNRYQHSSRKNKTIINRTSERVSKLLEVLDNHT